MPSRSESHTHSFRHAPPSCVVCSQKVNVIDLKLPAAHVRHLGALPDLIPACRIFASTMATVTAFFHAPRLLYARGNAAPLSWPRSTCTPTLTTRGMLTSMARGSNATNNDDTTNINKRHRTPLSQRPAHRRRPRTDDPDDMRLFYTIDQRANVEEACSVASLSAINLEKYLHHSPVPRHTREAFDKFRRWRTRPGARPQLCLDAGCGQARSSLKLARQLPQCDVVGIDKSEARLTRNKAFRDEAGLPKQDSNVLLLQADLIPFWRLCWEHDIYPSYQFILYPNPYPRVSDLKVRAFAGVGCCPQFPFLFHATGTEK